MRQDPESASTNERQNKLLHCVFLIVTLLFYNIAFCQTPAYSLTGGTSANSWPFNASVGGSNKVQWLYYPSNFPTAPMGTITKIYFRTSSTGTYNFTDLTIKIGNTSNTTFTSGTYLTGLTTVYSASSTSITIPSGGWMGITLTTPFFYDATQNIVVEASHNGTATGITVMQNNSTANGRIYGNVNSTTGTAATGLSDFGFDLIPGSPCTPPGAATVSGVTSTGATLSWGGATPTVGYTYALSTSSAYPSTGFTNTSGTSMTASGLTPNTQYYFFVRNNCSSTSYSQWVTTQFTTNPPCTKRSIKALNVKTNSATLTWNKEAHGSQYEYMLKGDTITPSSGVTTTDSFFNATGLTEGTKYYFFVRMYCPGGEMSDWVLDSFTTRVVCRPPQLKVDYVDADRAVVYWDEMPTAVTYEYEVSLNATPLGSGTTIKTKSFYVYPLKDNQTYYFHVRSSCMDQGFASKSEWTTATFSTFPTGISTLPGNKTNVSVYPNPARDIVTVTTGSKVPEQAVVTITDLNGRTIHTTKMKASHISIDLANVPAGLYMIRYSDKYSSEVIKLTKQ